MDKKLYKECLEKEVLGGNTTFFKRIYKASFVFGKNANYLLRKLQYLDGHKKGIGYIRYRIVRANLIKRFGMFINGNVEIGAGLQLPHPNGIVIGSGVTIGENCRIYQQVTIGGKNIGDSDHGRMPRIGNNCVLFAGCKVLGDIDLGEGTIVGANSVLTVSTEPHSTYAGIPARRIDKRN